MRIVFDERMIARLHLAGMAVVVVVLVLGLGYFLSRQIQGEYEGSVRAEEARYEQEARQRLVDQVETVKSFVSHLRRQTEQILKADLRERVGEAYAVAQAIRLRETGRRPPSEIRALIEDALRPMHVFGGKGHVFIDSPDGSRVSPPGEPVGDDSIAEARRFEPFGWLIGGRLSVTDMDAEARSRALDGLRGLRFGGDDGTYMIAFEVSSGRVLLSPGRPRMEGKLPQDLMPEDRPAFATVLDKARDGGGFVHYDWNRDGGMSVKMTYVSVLPEWNWGLATGTFLADIAASNAKSRDILARNVGERLRITLVALMIGISAALAGGLIMSRLTTLLVERYKRDLRHKTELVDAFNSDLEQFAFVASHDLREPLRGVANSLLLLERRLGDGLDRDVSALLTSARDSANRLDRLVLDLQEYFGIGRHGESFAPVSLDSVLSRALNELGRTIRDKAARVDLPADLAGVMVRGDRPQLARLFAGLIDNGIKYHAPDSPPQIAVSLRRVESDWEISVADDGIGIESQYFERIFGIFQRLHSHQTYGGTGIGLALCRKIAERHGGSIDVQSEVGRGSVFRVRLPAA